MTLTAEAFAQETTEVLLVLLTIEHEDITTIRLVDNNEDIISNSETFTAFPFSVVLPDSREDSPSHAQLTIDNVSREISEVVRTVSSAPTVTISIIKASAPDTLQRTFPFLEMRNIQWTATLLKADLTKEDFTEEPFPAGHFVPSQFPGLFE